MLVMTDGCTEQQSNLPREYDGTSSLDVVVEALVVISVPGEVVKGLFGLKVLKLHEHFGIDILHGLHKLIHELLHDGGRWALGPQTQVKRVLEVVFICSAGIQDNRKGLLGVDTSGPSVQRELTNLPQ
jgi:hypothetical protein